MGLFKNLIQLALRDNTEFLIKSLKSTTTNEPKTKPFSVKLCETVERAEKTRKSILHSNLPEKDRLQIADEILYLIDDLQELEVSQFTEPLQTTEPTGSDW